jgi:hypothetical protein
VKKNEVSLPQLRGQFVANSVLLESLLQALPADSLRLLYERHAENARDTADVLRRAKCPAEELDAYNQFAENNQVVIGRIWRKTI